MIIPKHLKGTFINLLQLISTFQMNKIISAEKFVKKIKKK